MPPVNGRRTLTRAIVVAVLAWLVWSAAAPGAPAPAPAPPQSADGWITHPDARTAPVVLRFRRTFEIVRPPTRYVVRVTADNRFVLYVNGNRVGAGPSVGDIGHWRYASIDLAPFLKTGRNVVAATVWNGVKSSEPVPAQATTAQRNLAIGKELFGQTAPLFQQSVATGFRITGIAATAGIGTDRPGWRVKMDQGHRFTNGFRQLAPDYYVAGQPETIEAARTDWEWQGATERGDGWVDSVPALEATQRTLVADRLPPQRHVSVSSGTGVRSDLPLLMAFPASAVVVPANSHVKLLIRRDAMTTAYPALQVSGGAGATIGLTYAEALRDEKGRKGDRDLVANLKIKGLQDTFLPDGERRTFMPLWWRTWRYLEMDVRTGAAPLNLERLDTFETGYPFKKVGSFVSSDPDLGAIWRIGWRTALVDAHETYMDSAYWEQLQYAGDTRLQMLISYAVAGDARLAEQAIDAFANSNADGGLIQGAWPSRGANVIAPFALSWIGMLHDWRMEQPDTAVLRRHVGRMREIVRWFEPWQGKSGLLGRNPHWNFVDWVGEASIDRSVFPSFSAGGESCLTSVLYLGALQQAAQIEQAVGSPIVAASDRARAAGLRTALRRHCWVEDRGLFADNPDKTVFSQHMNALAVLYDVVPRGEGREVLKRITLPDHGIAPPAGILPTSYYFSWYLVRAFDHVDQSARYPELLKTWRDLLRLNLTTWPEKRGDSRSDTHAWSAHPTTDLITLVAGIRSSAPGYAAVMIAPHLGDLTMLDATAATPRGAVRTVYRRTRRGLSVNIWKPAGLPATLKFGTRTIPIKAKATKFHIVLTT